ncbi:MAG TPA: hypothetical protein PKL77_04785 [Candidatus Omnitrophota bacterium]|nr:hypothetical protein [Candidatus Omnitrophota bacterium]HPT07712.1 hypothetical protein [Candidatus Omnitrophota bacterium]
MSTWKLVLIEPAKSVLAEISKFLVNVMLVILILIVGWVLAKFIRTVVTKVLRGAKLDDLSDKIELDALLDKGGIKYSLSELIGVICYWLALLVTFVVAVNAIGLTVAADLLNKIVLYVPNVIAAIFIIILGMFVSTVLKNIVQTAANNAGVSQVALLSKITEVVVIAFAFITALKQLRIDTQIVEWTMYITMGSLGLALALAFGIGCKDLAAKMAAEFLDKIKKK